MKYVLSIILPTYNTEAYLNRCVDSLIDPRINGKVEIIIVNDDSKDNSLTIARQYEAKYSFVVVIDKENGGHGSTINAGAKVAQGKYFRVLDSDDWFNTETLVEYIFKLEMINTDAVVTWLYLEHLYKNHTEKQALFGIEKTIDYGKIYTFDNFDFNGRYIQMAQVAYKTDIIKRAKPLQHNTFYVDNEFLLYPMLYVETFMFLDLYIYHYFIGRPNQSMNLDILRRNIDHIRRVALTTVGFLEQHSDLPSKKQQYMYGIVSHLICSYYSYLLARFHKNRKWAYKLLKSYDKELKEYNIKFYQDIQSNVYVKSYRAMPFIFTFVSPYLYSVFNFFRKTNGLFNSK